jgi:hypothetical protein
MAGKTINFYSEDGKDEALRYSKLRGFNTFTNFFREMLKKDMRENNYKPKNRM